MSKTSDAATPIILTLRRLMVSEIESITASWENASCSPENEGMSSSPPAEARRSRVMPYGTSLQDGQFPPQAVVAPDKRCEGGISPGENPTSESGLSEV